MTKIEEMQNKLFNLLTKMQNCLDNDKLDEATAVKAEIQALQDKISAQVFIDEANQMNFKENAKIPDNSQTKQNASYIRACLKKFSRQPVTDVENSLLKILTALQDWLTLQTVQTALSAMTFHSLRLHFHLPKRVHL